MCGPIALALPGQYQSRTTLITSRLLYNGGRVVTYVALGLIAGFVGKTIFLAGYQSTLSITLGILILLAVILPSGTVARFVGIASFHRLQERIRASWGKLFRNSSHLSLLSIGLLNGFLPCGLVYAAMAGAASTGSIIEGGTFMLFFGLGTFPIMMVTSLLGNFVSQSVRSVLRRFVPIAGIILGVLFILRGLSLGIPYISPDLFPGIENADQMKCH